MAEIKTIKKTALLILTLLLSVLGLSSSFAAQSGPLRDGFIISGVDGLLKSEGQKFYFEFAPGAEAEDSPLKTGLKLELLPSAMLEKMVADSQKHLSANYRLWGKVTRYKNSNFVFCTYFLPLETTTEQKRTEKSDEPKTTQQTKELKSEAAIDEPNDILTFPQEIKTKLSTGRSARARQLRKATGPERDIILTDKAGFILVPRQRNQQYEINVNKFGMFAPDAFGRDINSDSMRLLPCRVLELAERERATEPEQVRFKAAGIVTKYKGEYYLLLQKATRLYSYGNFDR